MLGRKMHIQSIVTETSNCILTVTTKDFKGPLEFWYICVATVRGIYSQDWSMNLSDHMNLCNFVLGSDEGSKDTPAVNQSTYLLS